MLQTKQEILYWIIKNLDGNFIETGITKDRKPYVITDSEIAADSLTETLYNLGFVEQNKDNSDGDYIRIEIVSEKGFYEVKFVGI